MRKHSMLSPRFAMRCLMWGLVALLVVLHQDYWQWDDASLVFGILPHSLAYHAAVSMLAAAVWLLATTFCWPEDLEDSDSGTDGAGKERPV